MSTYELKSGGNVNICWICENTYEHYLNVIKRECLIDGEPLTVTRDDEIIIKKEGIMRLEQESKDNEMADLIQNEQQIYYFNNADTELNHHVIDYAAEFIGLDKPKVLHVKYGHFIDLHFHLDEWDGLSNISIYLDSMNKKIEKSKKPEEKEWRERTRKWYSGRFECYNDLYNTTFGFAQYDKEPCGDVYVNYQFTCSKSYKIARLVKELLIAKGWSFR
ncbi:hypothetical protein [Paenibacillus odorifer]|uniref:hypothetical protein n=1 Tax=Paenibacillus odorifer TaxID=189426 RepID=UPI001180B435|nr:hypothetical protein [Paenibacillus odorifer]